VRKAAVVILNWNGRQLLEQFLPIVVRYSQEATVYVADNASDDDSVAFVEANFPTVRIIQNPINTGFAKGYNDALRFVEEEIYVLLNSDVEVTENWLKPALEIFAREPQTAVIQPKILSYRQKDYFEYAGAGGGFLDKYGYPFCRGRIFGNLEKDTGQYNDTTEIFWASGACFFIRKDVFRELKCFDPSYFAHQEEIDLCWRAINHHYKIKYCGQSTVYHVGGATLNSQDPQKTYLNFRNSLFTLIKNLPSRKLVPVILSRLVLDGIAAMDFLIKGKFSHIWAILKAHLAFYFMFFHFYEKRTMFQQKKYFRVKSVVYAYFVRKKRTFSSLF
jgi:hypothetical protein